MLFSLGGAIFRALKAWVLRVVFGCAEVVLKQCCPGVEMGGKRTFSASARVRPKILKADFGCLNLVCKVVVALDVRERTAPVA